MIPPQDPITAQFPAAAPTIDAALVLSRPAAGARGHPASHSSPPRRSPAPFLSRRAAIATGKFAPAPRRVHREPTAPRLLDQSRR